MKIEKKYLDEMKRCYCASNISFDGENHVLLASEDPEVACNMYYGKDFEKKQNVWTIPGGCMSIVPIPGKEKEFLAVQEFYLKVTPSLAKIVWGKYEDGEWKFKDVVSIPYVHRFGIFHANGINYLIAATVDRNHGFWQTKKGGKDVGYFGSDQGILRVSAPEKRGGQWKTELIMEGHIGEIATIDIDNDGEDEIMTIEEFHGDTIQIYKKIDGKYTKVWKYDNEIDFAHALVGTKLAGQNAFVCGVRRKDCELFAVTYEDGEYKVTMIEKGVGPANLCAWVKLSGFSREYDYPHYQIAPKRTPYCQVQLGEWRVGPANLCVVNEKDRDIIVAANHTANEAAVYFVTE